MLDIEFFVVVTIVVCTNVASEIEQTNFLKYLHLLQTLLSLLTY